MLTNNFLLSVSLNQIHCWSESEQHPMKRMLLTRLGGVGVAAIEVALIIFKSAEIGIVCGKQALMTASKEAVRLFPDLKVQWIRDNAAEESLLEPIKASYYEIFQLVKGLASSIFLGIVFSPESNFKYHLQLNLVVDDLAVRSKEKLTAKLQAEEQKAVITKARHARFSELEAEELEVNRANAEEYSVNSRLAELLASPS